jgi:hypothetical protein
MNIIQKATLAVGLLAICVPLLFPVWEITYSNHAGLDRWSADKSSGKPVQEQVWEQKTTQTLVTRRLFCHVPSDGDVKAFEMQRDISASVKAEKGPVENPWQLASLVSARIRYDRVILETVVVGIITACVTVFIGLAANWKKKESTNE